MSLFGKKLLLLRKNSKNKKKNWQESVTFYLKMCYFLAKSVTRQYFSPKIEFSEKITYERAKKVLHITQKVVTFGKKSYFSDNNFFQKNPNWQNNCYFSVCKDYGFGVTFWWKQLLLGKSFFF